MERAIKKNGIAYGTEEVRPGYAFVQPQEVNRYYDYESAMICGTIFPELCIPKGKYGPKEDAK